MARGSMTLTEAAVSSVRGKAPHLPKIDMAQRIYAVLPLWVKIVCDKARPS